MPDIAVSARVDGRAARACRTRQAIVDAHLALIDEGDLKPTGERIAERAGVSLRALWTNFKDMETLFAATSEQVVRRTDTIFHAIAPDLPLPRRIDEFCRQRARVLEMLAPAARASQIREPFSPQLRMARGRTIARVRAEIEELFATELALAGAGRADLLHALTVASTWAAWAMLRDEAGLDVDEARNVLTRTVSALLMATIAAGLS